MPETPPRRWPLPAIIGAIVLLAVVVGVVITVAQPPGRQATTAPTTAAPTTGPATTPASSSPTRAGIGDGIYAVGTEIQPGVYTTTVPVGKPFGCYWARLRSFGQADSIIDEDNLDPGETQRVTVKASDRGFKVSNGCTWYPVL